MGYTAAAKNGMLDGAPLRQRITDLSLHSADPGATGANEVTGGGYTRAAVVEADFTAAAAGAFTLVADEPFVGPSEGACTFFGSWDGTTFLGGGALTGDQAFNVAGEYILKAGTSFDLNA